MAYTVTAHGDFWCNSGTRLHRVIVSGDGTRADALTAAIDYCGPDLADDTSGWCANGTRWYRYIVRSCSRNCDPIARKD
jgi:hypothetical protein